MPLDIIDTKGELRYHEKNRYSWGWKDFIDLGTLAKNTWEATRNKYDDFIETIRSEDKSTFVFVVYPEYMPIIEAWRTSQELKKQVGIETALVAVNYILPIEYDYGSFFESRRRQQEKYLAEIEPRFHTPLFLVHSWIKPPRE